MSTLGIVLLVIIVLLLVGALPTWGPTRSWGWGPSGLVGLILLVLVILILTGAFRSAGI